MMDLGTATVSAAAKAILWVLPFAALMLWQTLRFKGTSVLSFTQRRITLHSVNSKKDFKECKLLGLTREGSRDASALLPSWLDRIIHF